MDTPHRISGAIPVCAFRIFCLSAISLVSPQILADVDDTDVAIQGTSEDDDITVAAPQQPSASTSVLTGDKLTSAAVGVDADGGNDSVTVNADIDAQATADALLLFGPRKTEASAEARGVKGGDGDDTATNEALLNSRASVIGAYGAILNVFDDNTNDTPSDQETIDVSVAGNASASGLFGDAGNDTLTNANVVDIFVDATIGGAAFPLNASLTKSLTIKTASDAKASATALDAGAGADTVNNNGLADAEALAIAGASSMGLVAGATDAKTEIGIEADATANAMAHGVSTEDESTESDTDFSTPLESGGLSFGVTRTVSTTQSADTATNTNAITADADAIARASSASMSAEVDGTVKSSANSIADSSAAAVYTGGDDDSVTNSGTLIVTSDASADTQAVSLGIGSTASESGMPDKDNKAESSANATATATAAGIDSEGSGHDKTTSTTAELTDGNLVSSVTRTTSSQAGDDTIVNSGTIDATAIADASNKSQGVEVSSGGSTKSEAKAISSATSNGIVSGAGNDTLTNTAGIDSTASSESTATSISLAIGQGAQDSDSMPSVTDSKLASTSDTSAESMSRAVGIDAEGVTHSTTMVVDTTIGSSGFSGSFTATESALAGNDTLTNSGIVDSSASAISRAIDGSVEVNAVGSIDAKSNSSSTAHAGGLASGAGDDSITNSAAVTASSSAESGSVAIALVVQQPAQEDTGDDPMVTPDKSTVNSESKATATATAAGIDSEGDDHEKTSNYTVDISGAEQSIAFRKTSTSLAGDDFVDSNAVVTADSVAVSGGASGGISIGTEGATASNSDATATAASQGITTGGGADTVIADNALNATASSTSAALAVSVTQGGEAESKADANSNSTASAHGIQTDGTDNKSDLSGSLTLNDQGLTLDLDFLASSDAGADIVTNDAVVTATATSLSGAAGGAISIDGSASSEVKSTATSNASGISTGGGADTVTHNGTITSTSDADAVGLAVSFGQGGENAKTEVEVKAAVTATSNAAGIATDNGTESTNITSDVNISLDGLAVDFTLDEQAFDADDTVTSNGAVNANAESLTAAATVVVAIDGAASADLTSTAISASAGIDTGGGDDLITTTGAVVATTDSTSAVLAVGYGQKTAEKAKPKVTVEAASKSESAATGISADSGSDLLIDANLTVDASGLSATGTVDKVAAVGDDTVIVGNNLTTDSRSEAGALGVSVTIDGAAKADAEAEAKAASTGILLGGGDDTLTVGCDSASIEGCDDGIAEDGTITATSESLSAAVGVGVGVKSADASKPKTAVSAETKAEATSVGIAGDGGDANRDVDASLLIDGSGIDVDFSDVNTSATGNDTVENHYAVTSGATAETGAGAVAVTIKGSGRSTVDSAAESTAAGIDTGGGADMVSNYGVIGSTANSTAATVNATVSTEGGSAIANSGLLGAGTTAEADAVGISAGGRAEDSSVTVTTDIAFDSFDISASFEKVTDSVSGDGDDTINNFGSVTAGSTATAPQVSVAVTSKGIAASIGRAKSTAESTAVNSGAGDDTITNSGVLTATTFADAYMATVAVTGKGLAAAGNSVWDGGTESKATSTGIDADNGGIETTRIDAGVDASSAQIVYTDDMIAASGDDTITNSGNITTASDALVLTVAVGVAPKGVSAAVSTSTGEAEATGIRGGDGTDSITNSGVLTSNANANVATANISVTNSGVAAAADAVWDGGTKATATATGIAGDGGNRSESTRLAIGTEDNSFTSTQVLADGVDDISNTGAITTGSIARAASVGVGVSVTGVGAATSTSTATAGATAIDAGAGDATDSVYNNAALTSTADAEAAAVSVGVTNTGAALSVNSVWDGGTKANASARGIDVGAGGESIINEADGDMIVDAKSATASLGVSVTVSGAAGAISTSTSTADSIAIDAGEGADMDTVMNDGDLTAKSDAKAVTATVSVANAGLAIAADAVWDGGTGATSTARAIDTGDGADTITSSGVLWADSDASTASISGSFTVSGVAGSTATSTAEADATVIAAGDDDQVDIVTNRGSLDADATANAATAAIAVTNAGLAVASGAVWDGGTTANSRARGIDVGDGADTVDNNSLITSDAISRAAELGVSVAVTGVAGAVATSTGEADAVAIDTGAGAYDDTVINSGELMVGADAFAATGTVSVTTAGAAVAGGKVWDGGTTTNARSRGIETGEGLDDVNNSGNVTATALAGSAEAAVSVAVSGVAGASAVATGITDASAIDTGPGDYADDVFNTGDLKANADSGAISVSASITTAGLAASGAVFEGGTTAQTRARGIETGAGGDTVHNEGDIDADATGVSAAAAVSVAVAGVAVSSATSTAQADASGIDVSQGDDVDDVFNSGVIDANAHAVANTATVSVTPGGVAVTGGSAWEGGTSVSASSRGIETGAGADVIINEKDVSSHALSEAAEASVAVAVAGVAGAVATATAGAESTAIDAGDDEEDDRIESEGDVNSSATSIAASATVSFTAAGVAGGGGSVWDGGTTANSSAIAMQTGGGADTVFSDGNVTADSTATSTGIAVSVAVAGVAGAITAANSTADVLGISTGSGGDTVEADGLIDVGSVSNANTVSNADAKFGVTVAGNNSWDGGTSSDSSAAGIATGTGADTVISSADIVASATSVPTASALTFVVGGVGAANTAGSADARASGIDAGSDDDRVESTGAIDVDSNSVAVVTNVTLTGIGVGSASTNFWDGGTTSTTRSLGIDGGAGDDVIITDDVGTMATIDATATSVAVSTATSVTVGGVAGAINTSTANADAAGIAAGAGSDTITNSIGVTGHSDATAASTTVTLTGVGVSVASDSFWDGGTKSNSFAAGLSGGDGDDAVQNFGTAKADADSTAASTSVAISVGGLAAASAAATAVADATAIGGDAGDDLLMNSGDAVSESDSIANGVSVAFTAVGGSAAGSFFGYGTTADATATGLDGGTGGDELRNLDGGLVDVDATAETTDFAVAVTGLSFAAAGSRATAMADSLGLSGGDGDDLIVNDGRVEQDSDAEAKARGISFAGAGAAISSAGATGHATSAALTGGAGADQLFNNGDVELSSTATATGQSIAVAYSVGGSIADANADAIAESTGIDGDEGADTIHNTGSLDVAIDATANATSIGGGLMGVSLTKANTTADSAAIGLGGGAANDELLNDATGEIDVYAVANARSDSVSIQLYGVSDGESVSSAFADAAGMQGDDGDDRITNSGDIGVGAHSKSLSNSASVNYGGFSSGKAGTEVETTATGIRGGAGADTIVNAGTITVGPAAGASDDEAYMSVLRGAAGTLGLAGATSAEASATATTIAGGITAGSEDDTISNDGSVNVTANSFATTGSTAIQIFGSAEAAGKAGAFVEATGLDGGTGSDVISSDGVLDINADSLLQQGSVSFQFGGSSDSSARLEADTGATGIVGGAGADTITTSGNVDVAATSTLTAGTGGTTVFGGSDVSIESGAITRATGIDGGADADVIDSAANMTLSATSLLSMSGTSFTLAGSGGTGGKLSATSTVDAMRGGAGDDQITNRGNLDLSASSQLGSTGDSSAAFGGSAASTRSGGQAFATGLQGGAGSDTLQNAAGGVVNIVANADVSTRSVAYTFGGGSGAAATLTADVDATGIAGGDDDDTVLNDGTLAVSSTAKLKADGGATSSIGGATTTGKSEAVSLATGLGGGSGDDALVSAGILEVSANALAESIGRSGSTVFAGRAETGSITDAIAEAVGLDGGVGINELHSTGFTTVTADATGYALAYATGANFSFNGPGTSLARSNATARAAGVSAAEGSNSVEIGGTMEVTATARTAKALETAFTLYQLQGTDEESDDPPEERDIETVSELPDFDDPDTGDETKAAYPEDTVVYCTGDCIETPDVNKAGNYYVAVIETIDPDGEGGEDPFDVQRWSVFEQVDGRADFDDPVTGDAAREAYPDGTIVACTALDCRVEAGAEDALATYWQVVVTTDDSVDPPVDDYDWVPYDGLVVEVGVTVVEPGFATHAAANGNGLTGTGDADSIVRASAIARGVDMQGTADQAVTNNGTLTVTAFAEAAASSAADGDAFGDARALSDSTAVADGIGILLGDGADRVFNYGAITVTATASAQSLAEASGGDICVWFFGWWCGGGGKGFADADARFTSIATGIAAGEGNNTIVNEDDATLTVIARPEVRTDRRGDEYSVRVRSSDVSLPASSPRTTEAYGIVTGAGNDSIINRGTISVETYRLSAGDTVNAAGILTGAGADVIDNSGSLSVLQHFGDEVVAGLAIDMGAGDDELRLSEGSLIVGTVTLGDGNDTLVLSGSPTIQDAAGAVLAPDMGDGEAYLVLDGAGAYIETMLPDFNTATKLAEGTYTIGNLNGMELNGVESLTIDQGALAINSGYNFSPTGVFSTFFHTDGTSGQLLIAGDTLLDGAIDAQRRGDDYIANGDSYLLVDTAGALSGDFSLVTLPESKPLLTFDLARDNTNGLVQLVATVPSFDSVTSNPVYADIGNAFDVIAEDPEGELEDILGMIQKMEGGFDEVFAANSPEAHTTATTTAYGNFRQINNYQMSHLYTTRSMYRRPGAFGPRPELAVSADNHGLGFLGFRSHGNIYMTDQQMLLAANEGASVSPNPERRRSGRFQTWAMAAVANGEYDELDGYTDFDADSNTFALGVDGRIGTNWLLGGALGYTDTEVETGLIVSSLDTESWYGSLYASWFNERAYVEGGVTYVDQSFSNSREVRFADIDRIAESEHDGDGLLTFLGAGYEFGNSNRFIEPYVSLIHFQLEEDAFSETGAGSLNQSIEKRDSSALFGEIGGNFVYLKDLHSGALEWHARLGLNYDFDVDTASISYGYEGSPGDVFAIDDRSLSQESLRLGLGVSYITDRMTLSLDYSGLSDSNYAVDGFAARLNIRF